MMTAIGGMIIAASGAIADTKRAIQAPVIAIVDFQQVTRESKAGASIRRQVKRKNKAKRSNGKHPCVVAATGLSSVVVPG